MRGFTDHFLMTLRLNFRNRQALIMGYAVPVFFVFAFAAMFGTGKAPLWAQLGQLLTISALGGACFGMPVTLVAERERGVWRRYRLTPLGAGWFVLSIMLARLVIVITAALIQIALAMLIYHMPAPWCPWQLAFAFLLVNFAFLSIGLVIGNLANSPSAVQAFGQALFLPMIVIGGIGVSLVSLPPWAQHVALFLPGRYAVEALRGCVMLETGLATMPAMPFNLIALAVIGAAACLAGIKLFRWEPEQRIEPAAKWWVALAVGVWVAIGVAAEFMRLAHEIR